MTMVINSKPNITMTSKILLLIAKFFLPNVEDVELPNEVFVSNEEMYVLEQDRVDTNPGCYHPKTISTRKNQKRLILVSLIRRKLWARGNLIGAGVFIAGTIFFSTVNFGIDKTKQGINYVESKVDQAKANDNAKANNLAFIKQQILQLKDDCTSGKVQPDECRARMDQFKQQYEAAQQ